MPWAGSAPAANPWPPAAKRRRRPSGWGRPERVGGGQAKGGWSAAARQVDMGDCSTATLEGGPATWACPTPNALVLIVEFKIIVDGSFSLTGTHPNPVHCPNNGCTQHASLRDLWQSKLRSEKGAHPHGLKSTATQTAACSYWKVCKKAWGERRLFPYISILCTTRHLLDNLLWGSV